MGHGVGAVCRFFESAASVGCVMSLARLHVKHTSAIRDLRVRITGYSAVFVDMSKNGQDEIIRREELGN